MKIKFWSDFACPYCYIGEKRLLNAINKLGVADKIELQPMAFELDPTAPKTVETDTVTRFARKYRMPEAEARAQVEHISKLGRDLGLEFNYAQSQYTNTFDAHRLMKLAEDRISANVMKLDFLLFDAYFAKAQQLADWKVLIRLGKEAGLAEADIQSMLESGLYAQGVRADEQAAAAAGVRGVPYFVFEDGVTVPGAASETDFELLIRRNLSGSTISGTGRGQTCGSEGCQLGGQRP
ncbi:MAG: DsbA family oxidoreductase [Desulfovibrio sp.]|nr:DsbA family oxidoreductase [Desulfovibrio sp.]